MLSKQIRLQDLSDEKLGIYVRLNKAFQERFFSRENTGLTVPKLSKRLCISERRIYQWKISHVAFPLFVGRRIANESSNLSWDDFCNNVCEIKSGQRSRPFHLDNRIFPIEKDPCYWNVLFAFFCDGSSDSWCSQKGSLCVSPSYTSFIGDIMDNFRDLVKSKFGSWNANIYGGSIDVPPVIDTIFKSQHKINSFNTKSKLIPPFKMTNEFRNELKSLNKDTKTGILMRFLVDEGDKSEKSLNPRCPNLTVTTTSDSLLEALEIVLRDLDIKYKVMRRKHNNPRWSDSFTVQILRGKQRENYKKLLKHTNSVLSKYPMCGLAKTQSACIERAINHEVARPKYEFAHTKTSEYVIAEFLKRMGKATFDDITQELKVNGLEFSMTSICYLLSRMPLKRERGIILKTNALDTYIPYKKQQLDDANTYFRALKMYDTGSPIGTISKSTGRPWATVRDWVYGRTKPSLLLGPWKNLCAERGLIQLPPECNPKHSRNPPYR